MNGVHDLGGMHGMGPIDPEKDEPVFHAEWERRAFGVMMATFAGGHFNVDEFRHGIEHMDPAEYLRSSYYEHWLHTIEANLIEKGVITREELEAKWAELGREAR
jgi:nitrile hydratase subunit beta